jgi:hypothetical protein
MRELKIKIKFLETNFENKHKFNLFFLRSYFLSQK